MFEDEVLPVLLALVFVAALVVIPILAFNATH